MNKIKLSKKFSLLFFLVVSIMTGWHIVENNTVYTEIHRTLVVFCYGFSQACLLALVVFKPLRENRIMYICFFSITLLKILFFRNRGDEELIWEFLPVIDLLAEYSIILYYSANDFAAVLFVLCPFIVVNLYEDCKSSLDWD